MNCREYIEKVDENNEEILPKTRQYRAMLYEYQTTGIFNCSEKGAFPLKRDILHDGIRMGK